MSRPSAVRLVVAGLLIVVALVLATSALNFRQQRHKRAIGRNVTPWNVTNDYIPPWVMLLSREPLEHPYPNPKYGFPDTFPLILKRDPFERTRYAYDGYFAGLGIIYGKANGEHFMIASVESMYRASEMFENETLLLRGYDIIKKKPVLNPVGTTWHGRNDSFTVRHLLTFGRSGFGLYALKAPSDKGTRRVGRTLVEEGGGIPLGQSRYINPDYKFCWAYSMIHGYHVPENVDVLLRLEHPYNTINRFWGRWPVKLVGCDKASMCEFVFDRYFWTNQPENPGLEDMPEDMKAQAFPCGWQDVGAPIFCADTQDHEYGYYAVKNMQIRYLIVGGEKPDPNKKPVGFYAADCYASRSHLGNFTAFALDKAFTFMQKNIKHFSDSNNGTRSLPQAYTD